MKPIVYDFPAALVASKPARPRDAARLLVNYGSDATVRFDVFRNINRYLPPRSLIVLNDTKVLPARFTLYKPTGGRVRLLYLEHDSKGVRVLADRRLFAAGDAKGRTPTHGATRRPLILSRVRRSTEAAGPAAKMSFQVVRRNPDGSYLLKPPFPPAKMLGFLHRHGTTPLPPYIKNTPLDEQHARTEYQTVFARVPGSVAAPTASLHFTKKLLRDIKRAGHEIVYLTLHVNLGTFAPLTSRQLATGRLHPEYFTIPRATSDAIKRAKREGRPVMAVGTTVVRALESRRSPTTLFIRPGFHFRIVDGLITNFHVPGSSLLMLVAALTGRSRLITLYRQAIRRHFHLFSFGDAMLLLPHR